MRWRLLSAVAIIGPLCLLVWLDDQHHFGHPGVWLFPAAVLVTVLATLECVTLVRRDDVQPQSANAVFCALAIVMASSVSIWWVAFPRDCPIGKLGLTLLAICVGVLVTLLNEMRLFQQPGRSITRAAMTIFASVYVGVPVAFLIHLRLLYPDRVGLLAVVSVLAVVKASDSGAYFVGRALGKRRMAPLLSPKKTVEGAVGGVCAGCLASLIYFALACPISLGTPLSDIRWVPCILFGGALALAGMCGDLAESLLKRDAQVKDSSNWLPGLGGTLDIMDSILFAAPVGFVWWAVACPIPTQIGRMTSSAAF